ncbi:MAG TPA: TaqI-like C-terminal specificity domain-containing protein [Panacibacter sp.]|nr:TaqI-like C-terminal specificity domain-containing protein [Panacibacter sp.]
MLTKEQAYQTIAQLTERFGEQILSYKKADYNETLARRDFIDPFFKALGWDVDNSQGYAEAYREVIHEDRIRIGGATKAPDYSFRLPGGKRLFFVEAKKPSVLVKEDVLPAYQVRRYAWSAKLAISILTDFEELAVYDCTKKPFATDKASTARIKYLTYKDYLPQFDFLWDAFSKERVLKGSFDKYIAGDKNKKGTATVDAAFLASLDEWRKELAQNIALRNTGLNEDELNFAVQQMLDRLIFLRIAEDRSVEEYGRLKSIFAQKTTDPYNALLQQFYEADSKYNSGLFDFVKDTVSNRVNIDSKVLKGIINELYYPASPYEFSVLSVEILGSAYEQFLGKQIKLTAGHRAIIEEKPDVRKAGGVYYTPQYIVEYIVDNTVGKLIENKKPEEVSKLKIVDPACGSGSFLLGAYEHLLKWHRQYYMPEFDRLTSIAGSGDYTTKQRNDAIKDRSKLPLTPDGNLTTAIKKQILLNNLYGVDIDVQAVEVTKLSLLLKCMEGETGSSITAEMRFGERVLPTLDNNIKSGNSLVDMDFYDGQINFEPGVEKKVKPFSWQQAFPKVFKQGGFDAVIGNPPYVRQELLSDVKPYFQQKYKVYHGMADLYSYFFEKGISLLNSNGLFGIIVANKWMRANYGEPLRKWFKLQPIKQIIDFGDLPVFQNATTYPCIIISGKANSAGSIPAGGIVVNVKTLAFENLQHYVTENTQLLTQEKFEDTGWNLGSETEQLLLKKLQQAGIPLGEYVKGKIYRGVLTGLNEAFVIDETTKDALIQEDARSAEVIKPFLAGKDIRRYQIPSSNKFLIFTKRGIDIDKYPAVKNHLLQFKKELTPKPKDWNGSDWNGRKPGAYKWFEIQDTVDYWESFEKVKILWPGISSEVAAFAFDYNKYYGNDNNQLIETDDKYLLGILNSKVSKFQLLNICDKVQGGFYRLKIIYIKQLSIKKLGKNEKSLHDEIVKLVDTMLQLQQQKQNATLATEQEQLTQRIQYTDNAINQHVYTLYGLTADEIKIVEGG